MDQAMATEISALEEKVQQAVRLCQQLREENRSLRAKIATLEEDRRALEEKMDSARLRLESLLDRIAE